MRVAVPLFEQEIAPRFCATSRLLIADLLDGAVVGAREVELDPGEGGQLLAQLQALGVTVLLCGGINRQYIPLGQSNGIAIHWGLWGDARETIAAFAAGGPLRALRGRGMGRRRHQHSPVPFQPGRSQAMTKRIAISILSPDGLDAPMDEHFGRARHFVLTDEEGAVVEVIANPHLEAAHGAGPATVAMLARKGVDTVISGHYGPKASDALKGLGLTPWIGEKGVTAGELLARLRAGALKEG